MGNNSNKTKDFAKLQQSKQVTRIAKLRLMQFLDNSWDIIYTDLDTLETNSLRHNFSSFGITRARFMCSLPDNKYFCFSSGSDRSNNFQITFIISENNDIRIIQQYSFPAYITPDKNIIFRMDKNNILQTYLGLWSLDECVLSSVYYNNFIYIFWKFIIGYDLINRRWQTLIKSDREYDWCTCILFNNMILALENGRKDIIVIDPLILSISSFSVPIGKGVWKAILLTFENAAYLIDFLKGKILESGIGDPFNWDIIREFTPLLYTLVYDYKVFYKNCLYFIVDHSQVYRFDLNQKILIFPLKKQE